MNPTLWGVATLISSRMVCYLVYLYFLDVHITHLTTSLESKYSQAAIWGLLPGYIRPDDKRMYPLAAMVANLASTTLDRPALMRQMSSCLFMRWAVSFMAC